MPVMVALTQETIDKIVGYLREGVMNKDIAEKLGVSRSVVSKMARKHGLAKETHNATQRVRKILDFVASNQDIPRKELRAALSAYMGEEIDREYFNSIMCRHGITRPAAKEVAVKDRNLELSVDANGEPSYGEEVDRAFFELLETDDPPEWLIAAYEPWLLARKKMVQEQSLKWWRDHGRPSEDYEHFHGCDAQCDS